MQKKKVIQNLCLLGSLLLLVTLFVSSSMTYAQQTSVPFLGKYLTDRPFEALLSHISFDYAGKTISIQADGYYKFIEFFIRKGAHFGTYFLLAAFTYVGLDGRLSSKGAFVSAFSLAVAYASFDEFHQMLTGGRTPLVQDVILDSCGALCGILIVRALLTYYQRRKNATRELADKK